MSSINIRKNSIESSIDEIREMMAKITLKYKKNKNNSFFNDNVLDVDTKLANGFSYPIYPNVSHGESMYNDIRKYLLSKKLKTYRADYPNYILDA